MRHPRALNVPLIRWPTHGQPLDGSHRSKQINSSNSTLSIPEHGVNRYKRHGCRCDICRVAATAHSRERTRRLAQEQWGARDPMFVSVSLAKNHVAWLRSRGMGWRRIASVAGVSPSTISRLAGHSFSGEASRTRIRKEIQDKILAVRPTDTSRTLATDARPSARKLQALVALGWTQVELARRLKMSAPSIRNLVRIRDDDTSTRVRADTERKVRALYEDLHMTPGSSSRARTIARTSGWLPPLAWDDIDEGIIDRRHLIHTK